MRFVPNYDFSLQIARDYSRISAKLLLMKNLLQKLLATPPLCLRLWGAGGGGGGDLKTAEPESSILVGKTRCEMQFCIVSWISA